MEHIDKVEGTFGKRDESPILRSSVSPAVIRRLPRYHRYLGELLRNNRLRISSSELSAMMEVTASQIRQDLNCFGGFGQQGYGYNVKYLYGKISELLGVSAGYRAIIVGAGNLGRALVASHMFERRGVTRLAMFDISPELIGQEISGLPVYSIDRLEDFCGQNRPEIAVLTTPKEAAYEVALRLARAGIRGIWNFSNMELKLEEYPEVIIQNIHLGDSLMTLCYEIVSRSDGEENENGKE
jgi:redox-sensing transcriptional repressor